jgi:hypothetical protein
MFKVSPAILQTFIDTLCCVLENRVQYTNYFSMVSDWWLKLFKIFLHVVLCCNYQVHRDFLIVLYIDMALYPVMLDPSEIKIVSYEVPTFVLNMPSTNFTPPVKPLMPNDL